MKLRDIELSLPPSALLFPRYVLPKLFFDAFEEGERNIQAPQELVFAAMLAPLSTACVGKTLVERPNGMRSPCGVNLLTFAASGERKSSADRTYMQPVRDFQAKHEVRFAKRLHEHMLAMDHWETKKKAADRNLKNARKKDLPTEELESAVDALNLMKPVRPKGYKLVSEDATPQALLKMLHLHHPVGGIFSSEGATVFNAQTMQNLGILNKLMDGDAVHVERVSSESFVVRDARFVISLMVQFGVGMGVVQKNENTIRDIGLLARSLPAAPPSTQGTRMISGIEPEWPKTELFNRRVSELLKKNCPDNPESVEDTVLKLSAEAKQAWIDDFNSIESLLGPGGYFSDVKDAASKHSEKVARVAALFHCLVSDTTVIEVESVRSAVSVCRWYLEEFKRIFGDKPQQPQEFQDANVLGKWLWDRCLQRNGPMALPRNHILQYGPTALRNKGRCQIALEILASRGETEVRQIKKTAWVLLNPHTFPVAPTPTGWKHWPVPPGFFFGEQ
ncbi:DUF3987 domain-containing protein [Variovorax sp. KBS0712]|uniref:YfjI family protein n=1 Tax=Variovorax TaxID=34072 RepID=UPI0007802A15|nr:MULTISPECIES: YfjI family protein [Variovorax]TSD55196.1 DUF3987 domain-containing protein [Variovorax sp. KBS0712]